ncbi:MAG: transglutaminase family protein [Thermodesulfovibrionales bacterium]
MTRGIVKLLVLIIAIVLPLSSRSFAAYNDIEKDLQEKLKQSRALLERAGEKLKAGDSGQKEISTLTALSENIKASHLLLQEKFRAREEDVKTRGAKALERHRVMEEGYQKALAEYLTLIESLQSSANTVGAYGPHPGGFAEENDTPDQASRPDKGGLRGVIEDLKTLLDQILPKTKRPIIGSLPYRNLNYPATQPGKSPPIVPAYKGSNKSVAPDDTQSTEEAPISEAMGTLAQSLNWNPVLIYEYVKNNIETDWYWGCMKGAEETLKQKSGNDCDQSTLFAALLRASGFPTRYVRGTIEFFAGGKNIVIEKVKNLTGIDDPGKIAEFFQKAGIPYNPIIAGGKISNFQVEHIWIESRIPYGNYRGAIIDDSDPIWLGLDTSIKRTGYTYNNPMDIFQQSAVSSQLLIARNEYLSAIQTQTPLEYVETKLTAAGYQPSDLMMTRTLMPDILKILPNSMQFEQRRITGEYTEIPDELKHKVRFTAADKNNSELFSITVNTMKLSNHQICVKL